MVEVTRAEAQVAAKATDTNGRVRLKASFDLSGFPSEVQVILQALRTYGMFLADNGSGWFISGAPDPRWDDSRLGTLKSIPSSAFEVVQMATIVTGG